MCRCGVACLLIALAAARPAGLGLPPPAQLQDGVHAACAVFASDGGSVAATFHADALSADVTDAAGNVAHLTLPFDDASTRYRRTHAWYRACAVYFDRNSDLFAVGLTYGLPDYSVYVAVADAAHLTWLGHWTVGTESGIFIPRLYGFLGRNLVVGGEPFTRMKADVSIRPGSFRSLVFDPYGQPLDHGPIERTYGTVASHGPLYPDAAHNRLWFFPDNVESPQDAQPNRPVGWMTLTGDTSSARFTPRTPGGRQRSSWEWPGSFAAPDADTIVVAERRQIWTVHVNDQRLERMHIPRRWVFPNSEGIFGTVALSPDGSIAAFPLEQRHTPFLSFFHDYSAYVGTDFAVVDLPRRRQLRIVRGGGPGDVIACAVDHRQGRVSLLIFREDHWERMQVTP